MGVLGGLILKPISKTWYVRPAGGSYGSEDGTSYADAWDGFSNIDWTASGVQPGDTLYIAGIHTELFDVGGSGTNGNPILIRGDFGGDAGSIDSEDIRTIGINCNSFDYISFITLTSIDAIVSCFEVSGTSSNINFFTCPATGSGNQGFQNTQTGISTYHDCTATGNADDGLSGHNSATIVVNAGTYTLNGQSGINTVTNVNLTINDANISGNTSFDVFVVNNVNTTQGNATINNSVIGVVNVGSYYKLTANTSTISDLTVTTLDAEADFEGNDCILLSTDFGTNCTITIDDSLIFIVGGNESSATWIFNRCRIVGDASYQGNIEMYHCFITGGTNHQIITTGTAIIHYCIFKDIFAAKFAIQYTGGSLDLQNCTFVGAAKVGRGIFTTQNLEFDNCIFTDLQFGIFQSSGTVISNNSCLFDNTTDISGTITNNNPQTTDPKLLDVANNDFSLDTGSSCIGTGVTSTDSTKIDTADWGNGVDEVPVVTTIEQSVPWNIGAY